jgi:L-asparaginase
MKPHIHIISTGGTIACAPVEAFRTTGYHEMPFYAESLLGLLPEIETEYSLSAEEIFRVDSSDLTEENLLALTERVNQVLSDETVDGVVITHGTDTMEETAFFLNLTVKSHKPVVLTGAMRPTGAIGEDGPRNLLSAIRTAGEKESKQKGVMVVFDDRIWPARDIRKASTYHISPYVCSEGGPLGTVIEKPRFYYTPTRPHTQESEFDTAGLTSLPKVEIFWGKIGEDGTMLQALLSSGCDGVILAAVGNGTLPTILREKIRKAERKPVLVRSSRTLSGFVSPDGSHSDREEGLIPGGSFSPQKARLLLQLSLTKTRDYDELCNIFDRY